MGLLSNSACYRMIGYFAAGTTDHQSAITLDTEGYEGVMFLASVSAITATAIIKLTPQQSSATATTSMSSLTQAISKTTAGTTGLSNHLFVSDVYKPTKRYMSCKLDLGTANCATDSVVAVMYRPKKGAVTQSTSHVINSITYASPSS